MKTSLKINATYMRGGTSKGVFFKLSDLPIGAQAPGPYRDALLKRVVGSPDPYAKQIDGMGGATSSTSKVVIVGPSDKPGHDVDYWFGQVSIETGEIDWSGNCGNLTAAVGPFAIHSGLLANKISLQSERLSVRIWQANIGQTLVVDVPISHGEVVEEGEFYLDGVAFPSAEIGVDFLHPAGAPGELFPTGNLLDVLDVPGVGTFCATLVNAGIPTIFIDADELGYQGTELQDAINHDPEALARFEKIRAHGALQMGLIDSLESGKLRQHTPKIAFVSPAQSYRTSSGEQVERQHIDLCVRALSMGKLHHAMMGTAAVAIAAAACVPDTLVNLAAGGGERECIIFGHPSGTLKVGAKTRLQPKGWWIEKASMSRSARVLMQGQVYIPAHPHFSYQ